MRGVYVCVNQTAV